MCSLSFLIIIYWLLYFIVYYSMWSLVSWEMIFCVLGYWILVSYSVIYFPWVALNMRILCYAILCWFFFHSNLKRKLTCWVRIPCSCSVSLLHYPSYCGTLFNVPLQFFHSGFPLCCTNDPATLLYRFFIYRSKFYRFNHIVFVIPWPSGNYSSCLYLNNSLLFSKHDVILQQMFHSLC